MKNATKQLEDARAKWLVEELKHQAQLEAVRKYAQKRMGNIAYTRAELDRLRKRAADAAEAVHQSCSGGLADPEIVVEKKRRTLRHT